MKNSTMILALFLALLSVSSPQRPAERKLACLEDAVQVPSLIPMSQLPLDFTLLQKIGQAQFMTVGQSPEYRNYYNLLLRAENDYFEGLNRARLYYGNLGGASPIQMPQPIQLPQMEFKRSAQPVDLALGKNSAGQPVMPRWP